MHMDVKRMDTPTREAIISKLLCLPCLLGSTQELICSLGAYSLILKKTSFSGAWCLGRQTGLHKKCFHLRKRTKKNFQVYPFLFMTHLLILKGLTLTIRNRIKCYSYIHIWIHNLSVKINEKWNYTWTSI